MAKKYFYEPKKANGEKAIMCKCEYCGRTFWETHSKWVQNERHYCSWSCYNKFRAEFMPIEEQNAYNHGNTLEERRRRTNIRKKTNHAIRMGRLEKQPCVICGAMEVDAHHEVYDNPLNVVWLCEKHHREIHKKEINVKMDVRKKGLDYERKLVNELKVLFNNEEIGTSRNLSRIKDSLKCDILNVPMFNIQAKATEHTPPYHGLLKEMPQNTNYNVIFHKRNNKGEVAVMSKDSFYEIIQMLKSNGII